MCVCVCVRVCRGDQSAAVAGVGIHDIVHEPGSEVRSVGKAEIAEVTFFVHGQNRPGAHLGDPQSVRNVGISMVNVSPASWDAFPAFWRWCGT